MEEIMTAVRDVRKSERLGLRVSASQNALLRAASEAEGTSVSDFVLRNALRAAENSLADRRVFVLSNERFEHFAEMVDRDAIEVPRLRELMSTPTVLDAS
jgi:uncharacterized protein (DUF1778 family)